MDVKDNFQKSVLIIGAGVAGISASLDLADQGHRVYLVEKTPSIGGKMSQLDKTFPTLDCSICILAPKMVECARHPNIKLMTYSEVREVTPIQNGEFFKVKILLKPRYIDASKCTSCGTCASKCPSKKIPSEFEVGLKTRTAAYIPFLQAVPSVYLIDKDNCIYFKKGKCKTCEKFCPSGAIDFEQQPKEIEIKVASIIIATGFDLMDATALPNYGYKKYSNVVSSLEYERIMCASGPTGGEIVRLSDNNHPHKIAFILCVGSRNVRLKPYCSKICCMYATKEAIMTMEHHPEAEILVYYNDLRAIGKGHDEFIERAKDEYKVNYIKGLPSHIFEDPETKDLVIRHTDFTTGKVKSDRVNMVVLFPAVIPSKDLKKLSESLGIKLDEYGFIKTKSSTNFIETSVPGIYTCGCAQGPEDISTSVAQASGSAAKAAGRTALFKAEEIKEETPEKIVSLEETPRIGVFLCHCGSNIAGVVDMIKLEEHTKSLPNVVYVERNLYTCSEESQISIRSAIEEHNLNRVVIASCTPRTHLPLFQATSRKAGLNQYLVSFASIRELVSWVHMNEPEKATEKANDQVEMAVARAAFLEPLYDTEVDVLPASLIVGGGIAGMTAALAIAKKGFKVYIIEKEKTLGGLVKQLNKINFDGIDSNEMITPMIQAIKTNKNIETFNSSTLKSVNGAVGNFEATIISNGKEKILKVGVIIVAVGAEEFKPNGYYLYKENKNVITNLEFNDLIRKNKLKDGETTIFIQCVGSREKEGRPYCSLICCANSIENALTIKNSYP
ncbi:MAG: FAD-dependent oxidoreductase, partial [Promethearchaeota archaeon]